MSKPSTNTILSWLIERARTVEREAVERGRPLATGLAQGIAFLHAPDDTDLMRLMDERSLSTDPEQVILDLDLRTDLYRLGRGWRPTQDDLVEAPRIQLSRVIWSPFANPFTVSAAGVLLDANGQPTGRLRVTSFLIAADAAQGRWVRTWNRFYQLAAHEQQRHEANCFGDGDGR
jgi:hypothetical protein